MDKIQENSFTEENLWTVICEATDISQINNTL
jgi:hypothetical protein